MNKQFKSPVFRKRLLIWMLMLLFSGSVMWGQAEVSFYEHSLRINNTGMLVLGSWALANISIGAVGWSRSDGQRMYFHQMNLFWNTVNLSIAGIALYSNLNADYGMWSMDEFLQKQLKAQHLFLINAGLDLVYMGTGLLLKNLTSRYPKHQERLTGYGNSVLIQGGFLFVFDLIMFGLQHSHRSRFLDQLAVGPAHDAWGIALMVQF